MEWLVSGVWKWTKRKTVFSLTLKGSPILRKTFVSGELEEKKYIHRRVEMNCLIQWLVIESHHPERNREEELIKDYRTADS